jgi:outer membrane protein assembly factor BamB
MRTDLLRYSLLLVAAWLAIGDHSAAAPGDLLFKITAPNPQPGAAFGEVLSVVDGNILVGEPNRLLGLGFDARGRAYLFDGKTGGLKLTFDNPEPGNNDVFARALTGGDGRVFISTSGLDHRLYAYSAITGKLSYTLLEQDIFGRGPAYGKGSLLVANPSYHLPFDTVGRAYLFDAETGQLQRTIPNPEPKAADSFGGGIMPLAVFGDRVAVGADLDDLPDDTRPDGDNPGRVWVFDRITGDPLLTLENPNPAKPAPLFLSDAFGDSLAANEQFIVVGAINEDASGVANSGAVYVFRSDTGALVNTLYSPVLESSADFGRSLAITAEGTVLVGAWNTTVNGIDGAGHVYLFDGVTGSLLLDIPNPDPTEFSAFGWSVAALDDRIVVGARSANSDGLSFVGSVYVIEGIPEPGSLALAISVLILLASVCGIRRFRKRAASCARQTVM